MDASPQYADASGYGTLYWMPVEVPNLEHLTPASLSLNTAGTLPRSTTVVPLPLLRFVLDEGGDACRLARN